MPNFFSTCLPHFSSPSFFTLFIFRFFSFPLFSVLFVLAVSFSFLMYTHLVLTRYLTARASAFITVLQDSTPA